MTKAASEGGGGERERERKERGKERHPSQAVGRLSPVAAAFAVALADQKSSNKALLNSILVL